MAGFNDDDNDDVCAICFDDFNSPVKLPCCNNQFCIKCLEQWKPGFDNYVLGKRRCPYCQKLIPPTQEVLDTIQLYKQVSDDVRALLDSRRRGSNLLVPPFRRQNLQQSELREFYKNLVKVYGTRATSFELNYKNDSIQTIIPSSSPAVVKTMPLSVVQAMRRGDYTEVNQFLGQFPIPPKRLNATCPLNCGKSLLHSAVEYNNLPMVEFLLSLGADINTADKFGWTPFHYAIWLHGNDDRVAKALIRWGALPNPRTSPLFRVNHRMASIVEIPRTSPLFRVNHHMASIAEMLGKVELAAMLRNPSLGRHCTIAASSLHSQRRGIVTHFDISTCNYHVLLDDSNNTVKLSCDRICVGKPRLFHFQEGNHTTPNQDADPNNQHGPTSMADHFRFLEYHFAEDPVEWIENLRHQQWLRLPWWQKRIVQCGRYLGLVHFFNISPLRWICYAIVLSGILCCVIPIRPRIRRGGTLAFWGLLLAEHFKGRFELYVLYICWRIVLIPPVGVRWAFAI